MTRSRELLLKVGLFGLQDLRRLAPIGDIGYLNAISFYQTTSTPDSSGT
jgi:hypothetical protein